MLEKVSDRIYYMKHSDETDRPVLGLVRGDDCCLVVDSGNSPEHAEEFKEFIGRMGFPPVKYLVLTHYHWDHIFGLGKWDAVTIANEKTKEYIDAYCKLRFDDESLETAKEKGIFSSAAIQCIKRELKDRDNFKAVNAAVTYLGEMSIDLGGITCELRQIVSPHTDDSTIIYVPAEKTLFLGDSIYGCTKNGAFYYNQDLLFQLLELIDQSPAEYYICSHESICDKEEIIAFRQQVTVCAVLAKECSSLNEAMEKYLNRFGKEPSGDEVFFMKGFGLRNS